MHCLNVMLEDPELNMQVPIDIHYDFLTTV